MAKNFKIKLNNEESSAKLETLAAIDIENREKIAKEVSQHQEKFEPAPEEPEEKKGVDDIFAFNTLTNDEGMTFTMSSLDQDNSEDECCKRGGPENCDYEERRRNAVAGLADAVADLASVMIIVSSLVDTVLVKED